MKRFKQSQYAAVSFLSLIALFAAGCASDREHETTLTGASRARLLNAVAGASGSVNIATDRGASLQATNLPLGAATPYVLITSGSVTITKAQTGTSASNNTPTTVSVTDPTSNIQFGQTLTFALAGSVSRPTTYPPHLVAVADDAPPTAATATGKDATTTPAYIRLLNLSPDSPTLDLYSAAYTVGTALPTATPITGATNVSYGNGSGYYPVSSGNYALSVYLHAPTVAIPAALSTPTLGRGTPVSLQSGSHYTVVVYGLQSPMSGTSEESLDAAILPDVSQ